MNLEANLSYYCFNDNLIGVKIMVRLGANIHFDRDIALVYAICNKNVRMVKFLLDNGANVYARGIKGEYVIDLAYSKENEEVLQLIKDHMEKLERKRK